MKNQTNKEKEEKLRKAIKKMAGFDSFRITASFQNYDKKGLKTELLIVENIDAKNADEVIQKFREKYPSLTNWQASVINRDKNDDGSVIYHVEYR